MSPSDELTGCSFVLAQRAQVLAGDWLQLDISALRHIVDFMKSVPKCTEVSEQAVVAILLVGMATRFTHQLNRGIRHRTHTKPTGWRTLQEVHALRALRSLVRHYRESDCSLRRLAVDGNLTPAYLSQILLSVGGRGYREYLVALRLLDAIEALASTPLSIKELARKAGYRHTTTFEHEFQRYFGLSPTRFRCLIAVGDGLLA